MLVFIVLLAFAVLLLALSFFKRDRVQKVEEDLEQLTLTHMQDMYQLKKKIKILEEELMIQDMFASEKYPEAKMPNVNEILKNQVLSLHQQGLGVDKIMKQSTLPRETVLNIIMDDRGQSYE
ncbi:hypothetical protein [Peribacillus sp. SCS-155]|uniref:hypothetical protein n=1 Tax=Peribacillus sedimenti TaxID=3115297 RepID=UPI0039064887